MNRPLTDEEQRKAIIHRDVLLDIRAMIATNSGLKFFKYVFDYFEVGQFPPQGLPDGDLREELGKHRAGHSIFKLVSEADPKTAALLLAQLERERYEDLYALQNE